MTTRFDQPFWDSLYSASDRIWSGRPNPHLVTEASDLAPGRALDIGSGEGGDSVWLASRGWQVTAVDLSEVALARARAHSAEAAAAGAAAATGAGTQDHDAAAPQAGAGIVWEHRDILEWSPPASTFDLVSSQYSHFATSDMHGLVERLARAVAPGGTLLVVGHEDPRHEGASHHGSHDEGAHDGERDGEHTTEHGSGRHGGDENPMNRPEFFYTPEELAGLLEPAQWEVLVAENRPHPARPGRDVILCARRR